MRKRVLALALAVVLVVSLFPIPASAAMTMSDPSKAHPEYYTEYPKGNCTWYAWGRYKELCGVEISTEWGNATNWFGRAQKAEYPTGQTPKKGAIACWTSTAWGNQEGHVAIVEEVLSDGSIRVSQYNRGYSKGYKFMFGGYNDNYVWTANYLEKVPGKSFPPKPSGYIYLKDGATTPTKTTITFDITPLTSFTVGTDAALNGYISADNSNINSVKAEIINTATGKVVQTTTTSGFGVSKYGPLNNSKINTDLNLGKLPIGTYYMRYTATTKDGTIASKQTGNFTVKPVPCNGNHTWGSWTVTKKAACGVAGEQRHTCSNCGQTATQTIAALSHKWSNWATTKAATCGVIGQQQRKCSLCGKAETQTLPALEHDYKRTSSEDGLETYTCANCGDSYNVDTRSDCEKSGHTWGNWTVVEEPSCEREGVRQGQCSVCLIRTEELIPALGHDYKLISSEGGLDTYTCSHCKNTYTVDDRSDCEKNGHTWGDWTTIKEAVCEKGGLRRHTCSVCRQTEEETIPALEHDYKLSGSADGQETYTCSYCGDSYQVDIDPIAVTGVQLDRSSVAIRERGAAALTATVTPGNATNKSVTWSSADDTVAKVDEKTGVITAVRAGQTTVTVTTADGGFTATCSVSVTSPSGGGGGGSSRPSGGGSSGSSSGGSTSKPSGGGSTSRPTTGKLPFGTVNLYYNGLFTDVGNDDWFYLNVSTAYELGLMKGTGDGVFSPRNNMTLAEAITLAARIHKRYSTGSDTFDTHDGGNWYDPYVSYALEQGIVNTYYDYTRPATREQFIHILAQALPKSELTDITGGITFVDSADITYVADVDLLTRAGVINGIALAEGEVCFDPRSAITRAEVAAVVGRMVQPSTRVGYP